MTGTPWQSMYNGLYPFVLSVMSKNFVYFSRRATGRHTDESVFALSLTENVVVFNEERATDNTHSFI